MIDKTTNPQEAIEIAIRKEREAHEFYAAHAKLFKNEATRKMFEFLAAEEKHHQEKLQEELDNFIMPEM